MIFDAQLDQIGYYSPLSRSWYLDAREDGSLWKVDRKWNSGTANWDVTSTQVVLSYAQAHAAQQRAIDDAANPAFAMSDQLSVANGENATKLQSIRDHMLGAMKFGLEIVGGANPLVAGSEIATGVDLDGEPMSAKEYAIALATVVPGDLILKIGGKVFTVARGARARALLQTALGSHSFPVAAQAHHLFPVQLFNTPLGRKLVGWGIDLNGKDNGVWLPMFDYAGRVASLHRGGPLASYAKEVEKRFASVTSKKDALAVLQQLRSDLLLGKLAINGAK
jgi:hypothetical protein